MYHKKKYSLIRRFYEHFGSLQLIEKNPMMMGIRTKKIEKALLHQEAMSQLTTK